MFLIEEFASSVQGQCFWKAWWTHYRPVSQTNTTHYINPCASYILKKLLSAILDCDLSVTLQCICESYATCQFSLTVRRNGSAINSDRAGIPFISNYLMTEQLSDGVPVLSFKMATRLSAGSIWCVLKRIPVLVYLNETVSRPLRISRRPLLFFTSLFGQSIL